MREILFRGKRADNGEWVEGSLLVDYPCCKNGVDETVKLYSILDFKTIEKVVKKVEVIPETVGQYTGLTDKNGKKIFEGDIVDFGIRGEDESYGVVEYSNEETEFYLSYDNLTLGLGRCNYSRELEVIGNIYDNPELLEQEG